MDPVWIPVLSTLGAALIASLAGILLWRSQRRKNEADAAGVLTDKAMNMVKRWEGRVLELEATVAKQGEEILELRCRVKKLETENEDLLRGVKRLVGQVESTGQNPVWQPGTA